MENKAAYCYPLTLILSLRKRVLIGPLPWRGIIKDHPDLTDPRMYK
jgi:hypothetical protein